MWPPLLPSLLLFGAGLVAGWVNTLAGAGGLIALPALLFSGVSVHVANGTLRVAVIAQSVVGARSFRRADRLPLRPLRVILPLTIAGGASGALVATQLPGRVLEPIELGVMVFMALGLLVRGSRFVPGAEEQPRGLSAGAAVGLFAVGFYGGLVQAGVGILLVAVLCGVLRFDLVRGNALKLASTLAFNVVSLGIFAAAGQVEWRRGALLSCGSVLGALLAVRFALKRGQQAIRWVLIAAALAAVTALVLRGR
ncbi:MAG: sulfite exporter TauE/SafE family protein [Kofleriaceae bacterium]